MDLKPCPFCGKEIYYEFFSKRCEEFQGGCRNPECIMFGKDFMFDNTEKWNTRPIEDALHARIAELEQHLNGVMSVLSEIVSEAKTQDPFSDAEGQALLWGARKLLGENVE